MANCIWTGTTDGDWSDAGNWSGAVPVGNDSVFFTGEYSVAVDQGLDQGGVDLDLLYIHPSFNKPIGTSGSPLLIASDKIIHMGQAGLFVESDANGAGMQIDEAIIMCATKDVPVEIGGNAADKGEIQTVRIIRGNVTLKSNCNWHASGHLEIGYISNRETDATVTVLHDGVTPANTTIPTYVQNGGTVKAEAILTDAELNAGVLTKDVAAATVLDIWGGRCNYDYTANADTTITVHAGGILDLCRNHDIKDVTNLTTWPGAVVFKDERLHTISGTELHYGQQRTYAARPLS